MWTTWFISFILFNSLSGGIKRRPRPTASYALKTKLSDADTLKICYEIIRWKIQIYRAAWRRGWKWTATFSATVSVLEIRENFFLAKKIWKDTTRRSSRRRGTLVEGHSRCPLVVEARALTRMASVTQLSAWLGVHFAYAPPVAPLSNATTPLSRLSPLQLLDYAVRQPRFSWDFFNSPPVFFSVE